MKTKNYLFGIAALALAVAIWLSGSCGAVPGKVTGGGTIPSTDGVPGDTANFGFNGDSCNFVAGNPSSIKGNFNYLDINAPGFQPGGVKMKGDVSEAAQCVFPLGGTLLDSACAICVALGFQGTLYGVVVNYRSTNPNFSGNGTIFACVADGGKGVNATSDSVAVGVVNGPFSGYFNFGPAQGNIQSHPCK
jgi:hypothetical protein